MTDTRIPTIAMVLAAGLGKRMRPLTDTMPKPLIAVAGRPLLDWGLDRLAEVGVARAVVNVHYLPDHIVAHVRSRRRPEVVISDESAALLDSGGGIEKALPLLGAEPFFIVNADTFWIDRGASNLGRLALAWDASRMDILMMLADPADATGHSEGTDFVIDAGGRLARANNAPEGFIYAGAAILEPRIFAGAMVAPQSFDFYFDRAAAAGRLYGMKMDGHWITVGTPDAIPLAERALAAAARQGT